MSEKYIKYGVLDAGKIAVDCATILHLYLKDGVNAIKITLRAPYGKIPTYEVGLEKKTKA